MADVVGLCQQRLKMFGAISTVQSSKLSVIRLEVCYKSILLLLRWTKTMSWLFAQFARGIWLLGSVRFSICGTDTAVPSRFVAASSLSPHDQLVWPLDHAVWVNRTPLWSQTENSICNTFCIACCKVSNSWVLFTPGRCPVPFPTWKCAKVSAKAVNSLLLSLFVAFDLLAQCAFHVDSTDTASRFCPVKISRGN